MCEFSTQHNLPYYSFFNTAEVRASLCVLFTSLPCLFVELVPPLFKQTHRHTALYISMTGWEHRRETETAMLPGGYVFKMSRPRTVIDWGRHSAAQKLMPRNIPTIAKEWQEKKENSVWGQNHFRQQHCHTQWWRGWNFFVWVYILFYRNGFLWTKKSHA